MAMAHVLLTEHPSAAEYAPQFQPLIHRAVQWLGSAPSAPHESRAAPQLEHHRRRDYCVAIVSKLHNLGGIDHQALLQAQSLFSLSLSLSLSL